MVNNFHFFMVVLFIRYLNINGRASAGSGVLDIHMYKVSDGISRRTVERYRTRIYRYGRDYLFARFRKFARGEAHCLRIGFGGTSIRIYTKNSRAGNVEVHIRAIEAYAIGGKTMTIFPELLTPSSKSAS